LAPTGLIQWLAEPRAVTIALHLARGELDDLDQVDWLVHTARAVGAADVTVPSLASAAALANAHGMPGRACALLAEIGHTTGAREEPYYARQLPGMVRTALAAGDRALAQQLAESIVARYPLDEHALCTVRAQLAEDTADYVQAADLYARAAAGWREFGNIPEHAYALLGQGRSLYALGRREAMQPLRQARDLFASLRYEPARAETESLLDQAAAIAAG
jgi:tetratricopeptide (TPR) repeat protein